MIDWQAVEVGDVVEFRDGRRERVESFSYDREESDDYPAEVNETFYTSDGMWWHDDGCGLDIVAIHKKGTPGALSHEERSRLWDKCEEYDIHFTRVDDKWEAWTGQHSEHGKTRLEAVMKCVAAIEQKENTNG